MKKAHTALYGNLGIKRGYCGACDGFSFVLGGLLQCCEGAFEEPAQGFKQECPPRGKRAVPPKDDQEAQLCAQDDRCFYCFSPFGSWVSKPAARMVRLRPCWDHLVPYAYSQNNHPYNFVAACQLCNGVKSSKMFDTIQEAVEYVAAGWQRKGYQVMQEVRDGVPASEPEGDLLQREVSARGVSGEDCVPALRKSAGAVRAGAKRRYATGGGVS